MARRGSTRNSSGRTLTTQQSVNAAVKAIGDIMRRSNCAGALQYVPELTWILFLRLLDEGETSGTRRQRWELSLLRAAHLLRLPSGAFVNAGAGEDIRTPEELLTLIEAKGREVSDALEALRQTLGSWSVAGMPLQIPSDIPCWIRRIGGTKAGVASKNDNLRSRSRDSSLCSE